MRKFIATSLFLLLILPVSAYTAPVTSPFGWREHPIYGGQRFHTGVDIGYEGGTEIPAMLPGVVEFADWWSGYGKCVILKHAGGDHTLYGHMEMIDVKPGQEVQKGSVLGTVGQTGAATGPHLHLEYWKDGQYVDPLVLFGLQGNNASMTIKDAVMPVYTLGGQSVGNKKPADVGAISIEDTYVPPETISFFPDKRDMIKQSPTPKAEVKQKKEIQPQREIHVRDLLRDAARRRRQGISHPYYSAKEHYKRVVLDALASAVMGEKPHHGGYEEATGKATDKVADKVVNGFNI